MSEPRTPDAERLCLEDLLQSEGWQLFEAHMAKAWGPEAYEQRIDQALDSASPEDELAITKRIRDTFKGVRASMRWPRERVQQLKDGEGRQGARDPYALLRRGPRRA